jgi:hypothetical protein
MFGSKDCEEGIVHRLFEWLRGVKSLKRTIVAYPIDAGYIQDIHIPPRSVFGDGLVYSERTA